MLFIYSYSATDNSWKLPHNLEREYHLSMGKRIEVYLKCLINILTDRDCHSFFHLSVCCFDIGYNLRFDRYSLGGGEGREVGRVDRCGNF